MTGVATLALEVAALNRRLVDTPEDFTAEPVVAGRGALNVAALVSDLMVAFGASGLDTERAAAFRPPDTAPSRNWLRCVAVATWLLHDRFILAAAPVAGAWEFLTAGLQDMAACVPARDLVTDPDRREELARRCLQALGLLPAGETAAQAADRLATLDSVERVRVLAATREAELRAAEVRKAMQAQAAAEAAAKASRE
jgi:hypothetical protein